MLNVATPWEALTETVEVPVNPPGPAALTATEARMRLRPDDALILVTPFSYGNGEDGFTFVVTRDGIAFRSIGQKLGNALIAHRGQPLHVAGSLTVDRWQGSERAQLRVLDVAAPDQGPAVIR